MTRNLQGDQVRLGRLSVGVHIGSGGFGVVHHARLSGVDFDFAIKFLHPSVFATEEARARERFFKEAETLLRLRHPHIVGIYGVGEHDGRPYILMELFRGFPLNRAREVGPPSAGAILPFIVSVGSALAYAHSRSIVHRDLKPSNLLTVRGDARVLDFGIAAALDPDGTRLTRTGGTLVGDAFSAPELLETPRLLDPRCDIYSLGACWFWALTGKAPKGVDWQVALRGIDGVTPDYARVMLKCLAQLDARYTSMDELVADVRKLIAGERPTAKRDDLGDEDAVVLGVVGSECALASDSVSVAHVKLEAARGVGPITFGIAIRKLVRLKFVEVFQASDWEGSRFDAVRLLAPGEEWLEANHARVVVLANALHRARDDGGVPF